MNDNKKTSAINWDGSPGHMRGEKWTKGPPRTPNTTLGFASLFRDDTFTDQLFPAQSRERNLQFGLCGSSSELNHSDRASSNALLRKPADGPPTNSNSSLSENGMGGLAGLPCFQLGAGGVAAEETGDPELIPFELPRDEPDEDVFGLGEFKDVFISEEDLARAREKLDEEDIKTPEQSISEAIQTMLRWSTHLCVPLSQECVGDTVLYFNFVEVGRGAMTVTASSVYWKGLLIGHLAQEHEPFALSSESRTLDWPLDRITNVNSKEVDERAFITFTMDEQFFIQIGCTTALQAAKYRTVIRGYLHNLKQPSLTAIESLDAPGTLATVPVPASIRQAIVLEAERSKQAAIERRDRSITLAQELYHTELERIESGLRGILQVIDKQDDQNVSHTHLTQAVPGETVASKSDATLNECQLCYDGLEKYALQPCSHRMCHTCMTKVQESSLQCPWDRVEIAGIIELPP